MDVEKKCVTCGKVFAVPSWRADTAKACSRKCRGALIAKAYAERRVKLVCKCCGKQFSAPRSHAQRRIYCSRKCADSSFVFNGPKGDAHYAWNGGRTQHSGGYLYERMPDHPFGKHGYVFEHRVVMETWMRDAAPTHPFLVEINGQRYLRPEIEVHHINEIKRDNRRPNLLACTGSAHRVIHDGKAPMQGEVWPEIEGLMPFEPRRVLCKCLGCGAQFVKKRSDVKRGSGKFCSRACYDDRPREPFAVTIK